MSEEKDLWELVRQEISDSNTENISTPKENYSSDKLKDLKLEDLQKQRDAEINVNKFLKKKPI